MKLTHADVVDLAWSKVMSARADENMVASVLGAKASPSNSVLRNAIRATDQAWRKYQRLLSATAVALVEDDQVN